MAVLLEKLVQPRFINTDEFRQVDSIGDLLHKHLSSPEIEQRLFEANQPGNSSYKVQSSFLEYAEHLGFVSEKKGLFENYVTSGLRPDYFLKIGDSGILLEVERGKTIMNNMDFLDLWKCHICSEAHYLFLMVPSRLAHNSESNTYNTFKKVVDRMTPFFKDGNYTNVRALFVYGY
ncbi:MAG: hypothetical protein C0406_05215 [Sideroxydans sp.]|nr:hypothetical protein [Sideroxydans sp.]